MKRVVEDIINSYENGISTVRAIIEDTHQVLEEYQNDILQTKEEREKIKAQLRETLTRKQHLRRKDFDRMIEQISGGINKRKEEIEKDQHLVREKLRGYLDEQKNVAGTLRRKLAMFNEDLKKNESNRLRDFKLFLKDLQIQQEKRKNEVRGMLRGFRRKLEVFRIDQDQISQTLRGLLSKDNYLRIRNFKVAIAEIQAQQRERKSLWEEERKKVRETLDGFRWERKIIISDLEKAKTCWNDVASVMKKKRGEKVKSSKNKDESINKRGDKDGN